MTQTQGTELEIDIDLDDTGENIRLLMTDNKNEVIIHLSYTEAQLFHSKLGEAITNLLLSKMGLSPLPPETRH